MSSKYNKNSGFTLFLYLNITAFFIFLYSLSYFSMDMLDDSWIANVHLIVTMFINPLFILLIFYPLFYLLLRILPGTILFRLGISLLTGLLYTYLVVEKVLFSLFKFHINSFVLKILQQQDAMTVLGITQMDVAFFFLAILSTASISFFLFYGIERLELHQWMAKVFNTKLKIFGLILLLLSTLAIDKTTYAWFYYNLRPGVVALSQRVPLYIPSKMGRAFRDMGYEAPTSNQPTVKFVQNQVNYPRAPYNTEVIQSKKLPNVILLMSDALRADMLNPEVMPKTFAFANKQAMLFKKHYSVSNGTTQGIFGLFYGLPSHYMDYFSKGAVNPILFESLIARDYNFKIFGSRDLGWLGTEEVVFFKVRQFIEDELDPNSIISDQMVTEKALSVLNEQVNAEKPLFLMTFYDSTHLAHFKKEDYQKFKPNNPSLIFNPANAEDREQGFNEYRNSVNFVDHQFGQILDKLEQSGLLKNSIVLITSDHGSEKYEHGHWGHASAFTNEQLQVPMVLYVPENSQQPQVVSRITSHLDVPATILELIGDPFKKELHTIGQSLLDDTSREYIIADGLANRVLIDEQYKIDYTPFEGIAYYKVTDDKDQEVEDKDKIIAEYTPKILKMFSDLGRFIK